MNSKARLMCGLVAFLTATSVVDVASASPYVNDCASASTPCIQGVQDAGSGALGVQGEYAGASNGVGVTGTDLGAVAGIGTYGVSGSGTGVWGDGSDSNSIGVHGKYYGEGSGGYAGFFEADNAGIGVYATATNSHAIFASAGSNGDAVLGQVNSTWNGGEFRNSGSGSGVYASSASGSGVQAYGETAVFGWSTVNNNVGVYGHGQSDNAYGVAYGVQGIGQYANSVGVYGSSNGTYGIGVQGYCSGAYCYAVYSQGAIYIAGNIYGSGTNYYSSDERLKDNIQSIRSKDALDALMQLRGVSFNWKDPSKHGDLRTIQRGFIAQEYEKVFPEWVTTDKEGNKMISTTGLDAMEVESIRELKAQNDELKARLSTLESSRKVVVAGNAWGFMCGGLALGLGMIISSRRKQKQNERNSDA